MSRGLGNNINVDFTEQVYKDLETTRERELELNGKFIAEKEKHYWTLNALKTALEQLKSGVDMVIVIGDIEQYIKDLKV